MLLCKQTKWIVMSKDRKQVLVGSRYKYFVSADKFRARPTMYNSKGHADKCVNSYKCESVKVDVVITFNKNKVIKYNNKGVCCTTPCPYYEGRMVGSYSCLCTCPYHVSHEKNKVTCNYSIKVR